MLPHDPTGADPDAPSPPSTQPDQPPAWTGYDVPPRPVTVAGTPGRGLPVVAVAGVSTALLFLANAPGQDGRGWAVGLIALVAFGLLIRWLVLSRRQLARQEEENEVERARLRQEQRQNDEQRRTLEQKTSTAGGRGKAPPSRKPAKPCDCPPGDPLCSCLD